MSDKPQKVHKTIFHTTEKSNFILNMTNEQFNKFAYVSLSIGLILIFLSSAAAELISVTTTLKYNFDVQEILYDWRIIPSFGTAAAGILGASVFITALIKQTLDKKQIIASVLSLIMLIFMYISYIKAFTDIPDYSAFLGYRYSRYEGFMVYLSYLFIFLGSMSINDQKAVKRIFDIFMVITAVQCIWGLLQLIPSFPSFYHSIPYLKKAVALPSGTSGSPLFLTAFLTVSLSVSVMGAFSDTSKKRSLFYKILIIPSAFLLIKTQTLTAVISASLLLIITIILYVKQKKRSKDTSNLPLILLITGIAASSAMTFIADFAVYDGEILWHDGNRRLSGAFGQYTGSLEETVSLNDIPELLSYFWSKTLNYIKLFPVTGVGPDGFLLPQTNFSSMNDIPLSFDRPYNEYLFYAATLGIPFCASLCITLVYSAAASAKAVIKKESWVFGAAFCSSVIYIITAFFSTGTSTVMPFVWFMLGICCCSLKENKNAPH